MKPPVPVIPSVTISDISADTGRKNPAKDFHVFNTGEFADKDKIPMYPVRLDHFIVILVVEGEGQIQVNLIDYNLPKNSLFIISPTAVHQISKEVLVNTIIGMGFSHDFLSKSGLHANHAEKFDFFSSQSTPYVLLKDEEARRVQTLMLLLRETDLSEEVHPFRNEIIKHGFNLLMFEVAALFMKYQVIEKMKNTRKEDILMSFMKLLSAHFKEERSVQYYADALFMTPKHLTKTVKEITTKTCGEFIDQMVIAEAKILLGNHGLSVANVAEELNFSDQFFFSKFFKKHTGINPSEYRRQDVRS